MKYIILVGDGMADKPVKELGGKTPLEAANTPNMDKIAASGVTGWAKTIPDDLPAGSDVAYLSILGYDPHKYYTGRAPLEAANLGIDLKKDDVAFRCNLVRIENDIMADYSAGHIKTEDAKELIRRLNDKLGSYGIRFYPGVSYRHIMVVPKGSVKLETKPPHDISDKNITPYLPYGEGQELILDLMNKSKEIFKNSKTKANMIWLWGQGSMPHLPKFKINGAVITAVDLIKGLGRLIGLSVINVPGATGYLDTNYAGKGQYAINCLKEKDFVLVHVEAMDEASHIGSIGKKIEAIENFDKLTVGTVLKNTHALGDYRILLLPDHATPVETKTHSHDMIPFALCGKNIVPGDIKSFNENEIAKSKLIIKDGYKLIDTLTLNPSP